MLGGDESSDDSSFAGPGTAEGLSEGVAGKSLTWD